MRISASRTTVSTARAVALDTPERVAIPSRTSFVLKADLHFLLVRVPIRGNIDRRSNFEISSRFHTLHPLTRRPTQFRFVSSRLSAVFERRQGKFANIMALSLRECSNSDPVTRITRVIQRNRIGNFLERVLGRVDCKIRRRDA